jgi:hypothetical protein
VNKWANRDDDGICKTCSTARINNASTNFKSKKEATMANMPETKAELTRQELRPIRTIMLDSLKKHVRTPGLVEAEPAKIPFSESPSPLAEYLKE